MDAFALTDICLIALFALAAHGLLAANDGMYGDSMLLHGLLKPDRVHYVLETSSQLGRPVIGRILALTERIDGKVFFFRMVGLAGMVLIGIGTYTALLSTGHMDGRAALAVSLLTVTYTGNQMLIDFSVALLYYFFQAFFLLGVALCFTAAHLGWGQFLLLFPLAAGLLFLGFHLESHLAYFYAVPAVLAAEWLTGGAKDGQVPGYASALAYGILPLLFWVWKERATPRHGEYAGYNRLRIDPVLTKRFAKRILTRGVAGAVVEPFRYVTKARFGWLAPIPAILAGLAFDHYHLAEPLHGAATSLCLMLSGAVLLALGNVSYLLVLQPAGLRGWATKNNVLIALPMAFMLTGLLSLMLPASFFPFVLGIFLAYFVIYLNMLHLYWVGIWAKHLSLLEKLSRTPGARETSVFSLTDIHPVSMTFDEHREHYPIAGVFMLDWLWGGLSRMVILEPVPRSEGYLPVEVEIVIQGTTVGYMLSNVDREGGQASVVLGRGRLDLTPEMAGLRYVWHRLVAKSGMERFLDDFTNLEFRPLPTPTESEGRQWPTGVAPFVDGWKASMEKTRQSA